MQIALAPMEGLSDDILRALLTEINGLDWCVTEFLRVSSSLLSVAAIYRLAPELRTNARTAAGVPVHVQLLGSDPNCLAENAAQVAALGAEVIDLNFGCPAKTVNNSRGGAVLLKEPELLYQIAHTVRQALPVDVSLTAKMRLGYDSPEESIACAMALAEGGVEHLVVHARTRMEGYHPPAHWDWIPRIQDAVAVPVMANGDIWTVDDWQHCQAQTGAKGFMLGRGLVSNPDLARQIRRVAAGQPINPMIWSELQPIIVEFWIRTRSRLAPRYAPGRLKQWLVMLGRSYPEAKTLFARLRTENDCQYLDQLLGVV